MKLNIWQYTTLGLFIVVCVLATCNACQGKKIAKLQKDCDQKLVKADTVTKDSLVYVHDTLPGKIPKPVAYIPSGWVKASEIKKPEPEIIYKNLTDSAYLAYLIRVKDDYFSKVVYLDSIKTPYGNIYFPDTVHQNRLGVRKPYYNFTFKETTTTITNTIEAKKKNTVWFGLTGQGGNVPMAVGPSLMFLQKNGWA